ncbi:hypothetical protein GCM10025868_31290 [Angustibacter aerolatus]|uniref:Uncharacterized protein n=1 Tax=Angustibacter aerolatus TaxID=1162965 RepID=A0ABQ6JKI4_9ACTN|nr:hypothetical protein GCM10025868_31290 [Angustibacter aerolatus]
MPLLGSSPENHGSYAGLSVATVSVPLVLVSIVSGLHRAVVAEPLALAEADDAGAAASSSCGAQPVASSARAATGTSGTSRRRMRDSGCRADGWGLGVERAGGVPLAANVRTHLLTRRTSAPLRRPARR